MRKTAILPAWARILRGYKPLLSIEITKECPLSCPGCYAYEDEHLGNGTTLRQLSDYKGDSLVEGILALVRRYRPLHVSIVGGEPLIRYRELEALLPQPDRMNTRCSWSRARCGPSRRIGRRLGACTKSCLWTACPSTTIYGASHTYDRILRNITGHQVIVHCTVTAQLLERATYLDNFAAFWSEEWLGLRVS